MDNMEANISTLEGRTDCCRRGMDPRSIIPRCLVAVPLGCQHEVRRALQHKKYRKMSDYTGKYPMDGSDVCVAEVESRSSGDNATKTATR